MSLAIKALWEPLRSVTAVQIAASVDGGGNPVYLGIGTSLNFPSRQIFIQNYTDAPLLFSFDNVNDHFPLAPSQFLLDDIASNKTLETGYFLARGDRLYVKYLPGVAPTTGSVYFSTLYGVDY
jgi:hypothetical protein